MPRSSPRWR